MWESIPPGLRFPCGGCRGTVEIGEEHHLNPDATHLPPDGDALLRRSARHGGSCMYWEDESTQEDPLAQEVRLPEDGARARLRTAQRVLFRTMLHLKVMQRERRDRGELGRAQAAVPATVNSLR